MDIELLQKEYEQKRPLGERLCTALCEQVERLTASHEISLGVPLESRVKTWGSIREKIERHDLALKSIEDLPDFVGLRIILLFKRNLAKVDSLLEKTFNVFSKTDASDRLTDTQFGYQSVHYLLRLPEAWRTVPSFADLHSLTAEFQVRTLAQHIWAAASHKLQYKREESVPPPVRRAIHRVSALLETVDLEFERVLIDRDSYVSSTTITSLSSDILDVDLLGKALDTLLPAKNKGKHEDYDEILEELKYFGIKTVQDLHTFIKQNFDGIVAAENAAVLGVREEPSKWIQDPKRIRRGVYFTHTGLIRAALFTVFGRKFEQYNHVKAMNTPNGRRATTRSRPQTGIKV